MKRDSNSIPGLGTEFTEQTGQKSVRKKRLSPLSVRLSEEQRAELERDAMGMALNAYVLAKLFEPKKKRRLPTKQEKAVARALRRLGHAGIAAYLASQIVAQEEGRLGLCPDEEQELRDAYTECYRIRCDLVEAMGLKADNDDDHDQDRTWLVSKTGDRH